MKVCFHIDTVTCENCRDGYFRPATTDTIIPHFFKQEEVKQPTKDEYQEYLENLTHFLNNAFKKDRLSSNLEIAAMITQAVVENPDLRFGQILTMLNITKDGEPGSWINEFYLESKHLLERIKHE